MKFKILAISGSTRVQSSNLNLIKAIEVLGAEDFSFIFFNSLASIPHFNPDNDNENPPREVTSFRAAIVEAHGVLICTPEYAMGVPGTLKNAIDWTVSSCEFSHKSVLLITASSLGEKAHESLLGTLRIIEADLPDETQLLISFIQTKLSKEGKWLDVTLKAEVEK